MKVSTRLYISSTIAVSGIIGIALFTLMTIYMVREKITLLTLHSTPLQVKTVQFQQGVEKLSAELLQLGLARDPGDVREISSAIERSKKSLEQTSSELNALEKTVIDIGAFSELQVEVMKATDEKFRSIQVFREEASRVNLAMARVDKSLRELKEIISGLVITASRRAATATKTLNEAMSDKNAPSELMKNLQNFRNEVDHDIELNKKINGINDIVYSIGVDAKFLDAKARMIMLSESESELKRAATDAEAIMSRTSVNLAAAGKLIREIKSSGFVDDAISSIKAAVATVGLSLRNIAASQEKMFASMKHVDDLVVKIKGVAHEQGRKSEANVQSTAEAQQKFVARIGERVEFFKKSLVIISTIVIAVVLYLTLTTNVSIIRSLGALNDSIVAVSETGNFTHKAAVRNNDEFSVTIYAFNKLLSSFSRVLSKVSDSSFRLAGTSRELAGSARKIHSTVREQSENVAQVAASTIEMTQTISLVSRNTTNIAISATNANKLASKGAEVVTRAGVEVQEIARAVQETTALIQKLDERSQQVGEIVDVIVGITDQTNLLALNAAIEAARAGEQGRGFAVVADEVRKLANSTAKAAVGITERVNGIQMDAGQAVIAMQKSLERVRIGVENAGEAGESLQQIVGSVTMLQKMADEIAGATVQLSSTAEQISSDIVAIEQVSEESVKAAAAITAESDAIAGLSVELKDEISWFKP